MQPQFITLPNGLRIILIDTKAFPSITTLLLVGTGSRYENEKNNGISHFLEHMFFKGSKNYPSPFDVSSAIEALGGSWNAFTSKDYTGYYIKATNNHFDTVVSILSDILLHPLLDENEITKEKGVISEEINMYEDMPQSRVGEVFENLLYPANPLGFDVIGTKERITSFSRNTFTDYLNAFYHPKNAVLTIAGGLGENRNYQSLIEQAFGSWKAGQSPAFTPIHETQAKPQLLMYEKNTEQAHFCMGFRTFSFAQQQKRYILTVLSTLLGGGASSKLFMEVREKRGLCYYISTGRQHYADCGNVVTQAGVPKDLDKLKAALKATYEQHRLVGEGKFSSEDLRRAKEIIKGHFYLSMEDSYNVASYYGKKNLLEHTSVNPEEQVKLIEKVTAEEVSSLAKELFRPETMNIAVVGPFAQGSMKPEDIL